MVELAMVILVIGIASAIIMPRFGGLLDRQKMRSTINVVRGIVRYVHARAALTKRVYRLVFDLENQVIKVCYFEYDTLEGDTCKEEVSRQLRPYTLPEAVRLLDIVSPDGEKTQEGEAMTHFHPTGLAEPSMIHLEADSGQKATLVIEPLAGTVQVFDDYVEHQPR
jgi:type II secretory pathway pseudopilin PulG